MRLGREMDDRITLRKKLLDQIFVADVALDKFVSTVVFNAWEIVGIPRVRQEVKVCDGHALKLLQYELDEV